jgi:hypothetical protein
MSSIDDMLSISGGAPLPGAGTAAPTPSDTPAPAASAKPPPTDSAGAPIVPGQDIIVHPRPRPQVVQGQAPPADPNSTPDDQGGSAIYSGGQAPSPAPALGSTPVEQMLMINHLAQRQQEGIMPPTPPAPADIPQPAPGVQASQSPLAPSAVPSDMGNSVISGAEHGVTGMAAFPGMASFGLDRGIDWAMAHFARCAWTTTEGRDNRKPNGGHARRPG